MATHSSILTWRIPWTEEHGWLQSMGLQRAGHNLVTKQQQQSCIWTEQIGCTCLILALLFNIARFTESMQANGFYYPRKL